jgi:hypothetical protein
MRILTAENLKQWTHFTKPFLGLSKVESKASMLKKQQHGNSMYNEENVSTDLEIIKGLHRNYEDGYTTSSMKPSL